MAIHALYTHRIMVRHKPYMPSMASQWHFCAMLHASPVLRGCHAALLLLPAAPSRLACCFASWCPRLLRPRPRSGARAPASPPAAPPSASCTHLRPWASRPRRCAAALTRARPVPGRQDDCTACSPGPHPPARRRPRVAPSGSASPLTLAVFCRAWRPPPPHGWLRLRPRARPARRFRHPAGRFRPRRLPPSGLPASHATPPAPRRSSRLRLAPRRLPPRRASRPALTNDSGSGYAGCRCTGPTPPVAACSPLQPAPTASLLLPAPRRPASAFAAPRLRDPAPALVRPWPPTPRASSRAPPAGFPSRLVPRAARPAPALADSPATRPARLPADYVLPRRLPPLGSCGRLLVLEGAGCPREKRRVLKKET
ncbi:hypothetical protein ACQJBY_009152 [Aegilops geniculata]